MAIWNMPSFLSMKCIRDSVVTKWTQCSYLNSDEMSSLLELLSNKDKLWAWCWTRDNVLYIYIVDRLYIQTEESPPVRLPCVSFLKHSQMGRRSGWAPEIHKLCMWKKVREFVREGTDNRERWWTWLRMKRRIWVMLSGTKPDTKTAYVWATTCYLRSPVQLFHPFFSTVLA